MKRSPFPAPLSREHHIALIVAHRLLRAGPDDTAAAAARFAFLAEHELAHANYFPTSSRRSTPPPARGSRTVTSNR